MAFDLENPPIDAPFSLTRWLAKLKEFFKAFYTVVNVTSTYTVNSSAHYVRANATSGAFTVTLPSASLNIGRKIIIKKIDASANAVTVGIMGSDTIEGSTSVSLAAQWDKVIVIGGTSGSWERL